ncbi:amt family ammonium transporter protein [Rutstroemia sp. NJR-2017a WRK4]|nr:amt family ammonium transporter protein [Rutstroemia sp. NJR-2017a WRK4]
MAGALLGRISGWVGAIFLGPRHPSDLASTRSHNILSVLVGAGLLWIGWNGFNGGGPYTVSPDAGVAVLNTNICTATSFLVWTLCDRLYYHKPSIIGAVNGMICGLVCITPAAGVVAGWGAIVMGILSGALPWMSMNLVGRKVRVLRKVDDVLGESEGAVMGREGEREGEREKGKDGLVGEGLVKRYGDAGSGSATATGSEQ